MCFMGLRNVKTTFLGMFVRIFDLSSQQTRITMQKDCTEIRICNRKLSTILGTLMCILREISETHAKIRELAVLLRQFLL